MQQHHTQIRNRLENTKDCGTGISNFLWKEEAIEQTTEVRENEIKYWSTKEKQQCDSFIFFPLVEFPKCPGLDERVPVNEISILDMIWKALGL